MEQKIYIYIEKTTDGTIDKIEPYGNLRKLCKSERKNKKYNLISRQLKEQNVWSDGKYTIYKRMLIKSEIKVKKRKAKKAA